MCTIIPLLLWNCIRLPSSVCFFHFSVCIFPHGPPPLTHFFILRGFRDLLPRANLLHSHSYPYILSGYLSSPLPHPSLILLDSLSECCHPFFLLDLALLPCSHVLLNMVLPPHDFPLSGILDLSHLLCGHYHFSDGTQLWPPLGFFINFLSFHCHLPFLEEHYCNFLFFPWSPYTVRFHYNFTQLISFPSFQFSSPPFWSFTFSFNNEDLMLNALSFPPMHLRLHLNHYSELSCCFHPPPSVYPTHPSRCSLTTWHLIWVYHLMSYPPTLDPPEKQYSFSTASTQIACPHVCSLFPPPLRAPDLPQQ